MRATDQCGIASYRQSAAAAVKARQFSAIISSGGGKALYNPPGLLEYYQECLQPLPAGPATLLFPAGRAPACPRRGLDPAWRVLPARPQRTERRPDAARHVKTYTREPSLMREPSTPPGPFRRSFWRSPVRGPWLTSVLGLLLLFSIPVVFATGLLSYAAYNPNLSPFNDTTPGKGLLGFYLFSWPTHPVWLYRLTQGVHVTLGVTLVPILLFKLWSVLPKLFEWPPLRSFSHALNVFAVPGGGRRGVRVRDGDT